MRNNLIKIKSQLKSRTRLLLMLKADAYGHGAIPVAKAAEDLIDWYGVAVASEGRDLRLNNISKPVLLTVFSSSDSFIAVKYNLTPIINNIEQVKALDYEGNKQGRIVDVHIKIDTGMNRLGLKTDSELLNLTDTIGHLNNIRLSGICTHFYSNDKSTLNVQKTKFDSFIKNNDGLISHSASSGSYINQFYQYDMVRIGLAAYGYSENIDFQPVMSVLSSIITIKDIKKGETAGYSGIFKAAEDTRLAIIRGGYYDGLSRDLIGAKVIIKDKLCKIAAVCMDISIVDIGNTKAKEEDAVIIIGAMSDNKNTANELAQHSNTIPYEILTNIKGRIERIYYD